MPSGGRRILSRIHAPSFMTSVHKGVGVNTSHNSERENVVPLAAIVVLPQHPHLPDIPIDGNLFFEVTLYLYGLLVMSLQYLHLYKTVWWLPHSHRSYSMNFYLIDTHLVILLVVLLLYRPMYCFIHEVYSYKLKRSPIYWLAQSLKLSVGIGLLAASAWATFNLVKKYPLLYCVYFCCPCITYAVLFGPTLHPLYRPDLVWPLPVIEQAKLPENEPGLWHICTLLPDFVREEVESFKSDFNNRVKQILFNATVTTYYMAFIPLCFVETSVHYNGVLVGQHIVMAWITSFLFLVIHFLPPCYMDLLHRCSLHLGRWKRVEARHTHVPYNAWSELQVWPHGALVKHVRGLFKADGVNVTAEPGNTMHARFYFLFNRPTRLLNWLLCLSWLVVAYQFVSLLQSSEWSQILSLSLMLFSNYYVLYKLMRDRIIMSKVYGRDERRSDVGGQSTTGVADKKTS